MPGGTGFGGLAPQPHQALSVIEARILSMACRLRRILSTNQSGRWSCGLNSVVSEKGLFTLFTLEIRMATAARVSSRLIDILGNARIKETCRPRSFLSQYLRLCTINSISNANYANWVQISLASFAKKLALNEVVPSSRDSLALSSFAWMP